MSPTKAPYHLRLASRFGVQPNVAWIRRRWSALRLVTRFSIAAAVIILCGMIALAAWVQKRIVSGVLQSTAARVAVYVVRHIEPLVQSLADGPDLTPESASRIDALLQLPGSQGRVATVKIWGPGGRIVHSGDRRLIGAVLPESQPLRLAWQGHVEGEFDDLSEPENLFEREFKRPLFEIYVPVRQSGSQKIIAVAELYEFADELTEELNAARIKTIAVVGSLALAMLASLYWIVSGGSQTITMQQEALTRQVQELSGLVTSNKVLNEKLSDAHLRAGLVNEQFLRRIGADLHDGPAQNLGYGLMRLKSLAPRLLPVAKTDGADEFALIEEALREALDEVRSISTDLALPELHDVGLEDALVIVIRRHERRTGSTVFFDFPDNLPGGISISLVTTIYRFVQEGLNNAYRHADGHGQRVDASYQAGQLQVTVSDDGNAGNNGRSPKPDKGLGLAWIKERVVAAGGELFIASNDTHGTRLTASFLLSMQD